MYAIFRELEEEVGGAVEIHCSRERSRAAWKIIEEVLERNVHCKSLYNIALLELENLAFGIRLCFFLFYCSI